MVGGRWTNICTNLLQSLFGTPQNYLTGTDEQDKWVFPFKLCNYDEWTRPVVIYYCFGGTHSSVLAASIHVGKAPQKCVPTVEQLRSLEHFDRHRSSNIGTIHHMGKTEDVVAVKSVGFDGNRVPLLHMLRDLLVNLGWSQQEIIAANTVRFVDWKTRVGGFLSCRLGWRFIGRPLVCAGARKIYPLLREQVSKVRGALRTKF